MPLTESPPPPRALHCQPEAYPILHCCDLRGFVRPTKRKLLPALFHRNNPGLLPRTFAFVALPGRR